MKVIKFMYNDDDLSKNNAIHPPLTSDLYLIISTSNDMKIFFYNSQKTNIIFIFSQTETTRLLFILILIGNEVILK